MSFKSMQPKRQPSDGGGWGQRHSPEEPAKSTMSGYGVALLLVLAVVVLCGTGFFLIRALVSSSPPAPLPAYVTRTASPEASSPSPQGTATPVTAGQGLLTVSPEQGYINTLVTVTGEGWWPGEPVFVFLRSQKEGSGPGFAYAAAVADDQGRMHTAFTFPNEMRWIGEEFAEIVARGSRSGLEASSRFALVAPTPTNTVPLPTAGPTLTPSETPWPTETPVTTATPTPDIIISDWRGEYYDNPALAGDPVYIRNDVAIDFNWGGGSPDPRIPDDRFSARWTRLWSFSGGFYRFTVLADDGVRFWVDGQIVVDEWHDSTLVPHSVDLYVSEGQHSLRLEYYENLGGAMVQMVWVPVEPPTMTPSPTARPTGTPTYTPSPTHTPSPSATVLPTDTPKPTNTTVPSATATPTSSPTPTQTPSPTPTLTPTSTDTPTTTPTSTDTPTPTPTFTATPTPENTPSE